MYESDKIIYLKNKLNYKYIKQINDTTINNNIDYIFNKCIVYLTKLNNDKCPIIQIKINNTIKKQWIYSSLIKCINKIKIIEILKKKNSTYKFIYYKKYKYILTIYYENMNICFILQN